MNTSLIDYYVSFGYNKISDTMRLSNSRSMLPMTEFNQKYRKLFLGYQDQIFEATYLDDVTCLKEYEDAMLEVLQQRRHIEAVINKIDFIYYDNMEVQYIIHGESEVKKLTLEKEEYIDDGPYRRKRRQ
jgi:hypothetical protein